MEKFIFTFKVGHPFVNHFQPVYAMNKSKSIEKMVKRYGNVYDSVHTEENFIATEKQLNKLGIALRSELSPVYCREVY